MKAVLIRLIACVAIAAAAVFYLVKRRGAGADIPLSWFLRQHWPYLVVLLVAVLIALFLVASILRNRKKSAS